MIRACSPSTRASSKRMCNRAVNEEESMKVKGGMLDADGHLIERDEELFEYMEAPYKGNNTLLGFPFFPTLDGYHRGAIMARLGIHKGYTINAKTWLEFLDGTGIESTVLYPTAGLAFSMIPDPTWAVPLARAYNNWFTDKFHKASPQRLRAVALVPIQDIGEAVKELRRAVSELGMVGAVIGANGAELGTRKPLGDPYFWPLYEEAERLDVPIALHGAPSASLGINFFYREGGEVTLPYALKRIGHQAVLFASDFPHETNIERAKHEIEELLHHEELSDEAKQAIFHDNIVRFYGPRVAPEQAKRPAL